MTDEDFLRVLVEHGLSAAGTTETMQDLKARYGVRRWFGFADVIDLPPASLFPEQTERFFFQPHLIYLLPPNELECDFDYYRNGPRSHALALERLTELFGMPEETLTSNTLSQRWKFERMSLSIRTFLRERTTGRNPLYERHPELWNLCRITIDRNLVRPLTQADADALNSFAPNQTLPIDRTFWPTRGNLLSWERGLFRLAKGTADSTPFLWRQSADIGWRAGPWSAAFERRRCLTLELRQVLPAKGAGYSELVLQIDNPFTLESQTVGVDVLKGNDTNALDSVAPEVASFWGLPLKIAKSYND
jgi:hypothetical protein